VLLLPRHERGSVAIGKRSVTVVACAVALSIALLAPFAARGSAAPSTSGVTGSAGRVVAIARSAKRANDLKAVILSVRVGNRPLVTTAMGNSMPGVPATTRMHFRIGNVAIAYLTTLLLQLQDRGRLSADDRLSRWFPALPDAKAITLRMLANSTSGYSDYVSNPGFLDALHADPFRQWSPRELIGIGISQVDFPPGASFRYSHTGFVILGEVLRKVTHHPVERLIKAGILSPLRLGETGSSQTAAIPSPVLHAYSKERGTYEESTFWSPSWGTARGANMTSDISDVATSGRAIGAGLLLSPKAHRQQVGPGTVGLDGNTPTLYYGMGLLVEGGWIVENPSLAGFGVEVAYLPAKDLTIAVVSTKGQRSDVDPNYSELITRQIAAYLAPNNPIPLSP
jgi:D-alanyl-D-alanine carboxypeptidase